jgi:hypothetical protein
MVQYSDEVCCEDVKVMCIIVEICVILYILSDQWVGNKARNMSVALW